MNFIDAACDLEPSWLVPASAIIVPILLAILIIVVVWPMPSPIRPETDPHGEPLGDQPNYPQDNWRSERWPS